MTENIFSAENAVIGSMLIDPSCVGEIVHTVTADDFRQDTAKTVFSTIQAQFLSGLTLDPVTISEKLPNSDKQFMAACMRATPTANNYREYSEIVKKSGQLHRMQTLGLQLAGSCDLEQAEKVISELNSTTVATSGSSFLTGAEAADAFMDELNNRIENGVKFVKWGIYGLDEYLHTRFGNFIIIGARPSCGKSAFALQTAVYMASAGYRVGFASLEMNAEEINDRIISQLSGVPLKKLSISTNKLTDDEYKRIISACEKLHDLPISFDYEARTVEQIRARALSERWEVCFIDYLQLLNGEKKSSRYEQVTEMSQSLQCMAHQNKILTIALSQLSRPKDGRAKPNLTDLRESGQLEQDADAVLLMSLDDVNDKDSDRLIQLDKNRQGRCCNFLLTFDGNIQRFTYKGRDNCE